MSTVCDLSCAPEWSSAGPRFDGHGCGAGDPSRFGKTCRQCYTSEEAALAEDRRLSSPAVLDSAQGVHVVMCSTGNPPQAPECSDECLKLADAVSLRPLGMFRGQLLVPIAALFLSVCMIEVLRQRTYFRKCVMMLCFNKFLPLAVLSTNMHIRRFEIHFC